jgi:hypothetical protein
MFSAQSGSLHDIESMSSTNALSCLKELSERLSQAALAPWLSQ